MIILCVFNTDWSGDVIAILEAFDSKKDATNQLDPYGQ